MEHQLEEADNNGVSPHYIQNIRSSGLLAQSLNSMKGILFTGFLSMVEDQYGYDLVDRLMTESGLPSKRSYTPFGSYDKAELLILVQQLSQYTNLAAPGLWHNYGRYMFVWFTSSRPQLVDQFDGAFSLLFASSQFQKMDGIKLYSDVQNPAFMAIEQRSANHLTIHYRSENKLDDFLYGLLEGCFAHYGEHASIVKTSLADDGSEALFEILTD